MESIHDALRTVEGEIAKLHAEITEAEERVMKELLSGSQSALSSFLAEKVRQLRRKEEQLRRKEREEELLLLRYSAFPSQAPRPPMSTDWASNILTGFWSRVMKGLNGMPKPDHFKHKFALTRTPISQLPRPGRWQPSLLWHGLDQPFETSKKILSTVQACAPDVVIICDVSGAGKTRTLYEIGVQQASIFLTGVPDEGPAAEGSRDLLAIRDALARIYPTGEIPVASLCTCLKVVLLIRSFIYDKSGADNLTFLFEQVMHRYLGYPESDPWAYLTNQLLNRVSSSYELKELNVCVSDLLRSQKWNGPVILDECQEVNKYLAGRFTSGGNVSGKRSMLDKLVIALQDAGINNTIYISGTGSLFHMAKHLSETWKHRVSVYWFTFLGGFQDSQALEQFADGILEDCSGLDFDRLVLLFKGRYRAFSTALEFYIMENSDASLATKKLLDFGVRMATRRGAAESQSSSDNSLLLNMNRTVLDDVYRFFGGIPNSQVEAAKSLVQAVVMNLFFGTGKIIALNPTLSLVEYGLARLVYRGSDSYKDHARWIHDGKDGCVGYAEEGDESRLVEIEEPLVVLALWQYYKEQSCIKQMRHQHSLDLAQMDPSSRGKAYESLVAQMVGLHLDGKCLANLFSAWNTEIPTVYKKTAHLVQPTFHVGRQFGVETEEFRLLDWIRSVQDGNDFFYPFFSTSSNTSCGPDMWFFLMLTDDNDDGDEGELVICAAQMKTLKRLSRADFQAAKFSLDFDRLFLHKKNGYKKHPKDAEAAKVVQNFPHYLKLVVTTDYDDLSEFKPTSVVRPVKRRRRVQQEEVKQGLLGVLDETNIHLFVDSWLINAVRECKEEQSA